MLGFGSQRARESKVAPRSFRTRRTSKQSQRKRIACASLSIMAYKFNPLLPNCRQTLSALSEGVTDDADVSHVINTSLFVYTVFTSGYKGLPNRVDIQSDTTPPQYRRHYGLDKASLSAVRPSSLHTSTLLSKLVVVGGDWRKQVLFLHQLAIGNFLMSQDSKSISRFYSCAAHAFQLRFDVKASHAPLDHLRATTTMTTRV